MCSLLPLFPPAHPLCLLRLCFPLLTAFPITIPLLFHLSLPHFVFLSLSIFTPLPSHFSPLNSLQSPSRSLYFLPFAWSHLTDGHSLHYCMISDHVSNFLIVKFNYSLLPNRQNKTIHICILLVSDIAVFVLKRDVKLQLTNFCILRVTSSVMWVICAQMYVLYVLQCLWCVNILCVGDSERSNCVIGLGTVH